MIIKLMRVLADNPAQRLRNRILFLTLMIFFIFCSAVSWAQNVVIQVHDAQTIRLNPGNQATLNFFALRNDLSRTQEYDLGGLYSSLFYQDNVLAESGSVFQKTDRSELFKQYLRQSAAGKFTAPASGREVFKELYNKPRIDEKAILRREWEEAFGFDVWSPYYKYKEIERQVKSKLSVKVFRLKGEPRLEKNKIFYVFAGAF